ncbi:MAG: hypothetical protein FJ118_16350 [Deltaproteobacteria bacterium]|nr:hypothetical protein [Deltaproteobacteria bacterium]
MEIILLSLMERPEMSVANPDKLKASYDRILDLLDRHGLLKERLPFTPALLEEAVFFCYKMRLLTQGDVKKLLDLDKAGLRKIINEWNSGDEGNCTCRLARNPFAEE